MEKQLSINYPQSLAKFLNLPDREFEHEMKIVSLVKLYELGKLSSGRAAKILGIDRIDFLEILGKYQVSIFNFSSQGELEEDFLNA